MGFARFFLFWTPLEHITSGKAVPTMHEHNYKSHSITPTSTPNLITIAGRFLSNILASHFYTLHETRAICRADGPNESNPVAVNFYWIDLPLGENCEAIGCIVLESFSKLSPGRRAGRPAAYTQVCPLFKKGFRSAFSAPLVKAITFYAPFLFKRQSVQSAWREECLLIWE